MAKSKTTKSNVNGKKEQERTRLNKAAMLEALEKNLGIVTPACKSLGIDRSTHYKWLKEDPDYKEAVESLSEVSLDFAESELFKQMKKGQASSTIFYLKTKGKHRGYDETPGILVQTEQAVFKGLDIGLED